MDSEISKLVDHSPNKLAKDIAIQTLKERCYLLQRRLNSVEDENIQLSIRCNKTKSDNKINSPDQLRELNANIAQLTKEKAQLAQHVFMVACENKKLWSRLSSMTTPVTEIVNGIDKDLSKTVNCDVTGFTVPHLIRSQTFTQTSPNPKLKARIEEAEENIEASLEEISLKVLNSFLAEKSELVQQYEQMVELQMANDKDFNVKTAGFTYLEDSSCNALSDIKHYTDKLSDMKKAALQQQSDLKNLINHFESIKRDDKLTRRNDNKIIPDVSKDSTKSDCLDNSETEMLDSSTRWVTPANSTSYHDNIDDVSSYSQNTSKITQNNLQNSRNNTSERNKDEEYKISLTSKGKEEKKQDNICPICGERFKPSVLFEVFTQHVQEHFMGDEEYDSIVDNYEVVVNEIGNNLN